MRSHCSAHTCSIHVRCEVTSVTILFLCVSSAGVAEVASHEAGAGSVEGVTGGLGEGEEGGGGGVVEAEDATGHQHQVLINLMLILMRGSRSVTLVFFSIGEGHAGNTV